MLTFFAGPIGDFCIILEPKLDEEVMGYASKLHRHGMWKLLYFCPTNHQIVSLMLRWNLEKVKGKYL